MQVYSDNIEMLYETSWEVCNKIGGIYTVLSTKAKVLQETLKDKVVFIGPDVWTEGNPSPDFKEYKTLLKSAAKKLQLPFDLRIRVGRWTIPGSPIVVLVKFDGIYPHINEFFGRMWELYGVDSINAYGDYSEGCAFGIASAIVIASLNRYLNVDARKTIAHFDEWTTGMGLLDLESIAPEIATVFTTHATSIGRSICGNNKPLYDFFTAYNGDQMASELNMEAKHSLEKNAAHNADCFTTVSGVTASECRQLLGIAPQVITPNGFEKNFVPTGKKYQSARNISRKRLLDIASALTGKKYQNDTFIVATSGRNEYRNKGLDLFIDSLQELRHRQNTTGRGMLAFIMVPAWVREVDKGLLARINGDKNATVAARFATHRLNNEDQDAVYARLRSVDPNNEEDWLDVIFLPSYLNGQDGVLGLTYYDMMPGLDATVFPSYYEPWGYTPLESIAFGVPTVTSDKAGFGQWVLSTFPNDFIHTGVKVIERTDSNYSDACREIADNLMCLFEASSEDMATIRKNAEKTAAEADWHIFIEKYYECFEVAFRRRDERLSLVK